MANVINDLSDIYLPSSTDKGVGFHIHKAENGEFHWHFKAKNGRLIASGGETHKRKASAIKSIKSLVKLVTTGFGDIEDRSK